MPLGDPYTEMKHQEELARVNEQQYDRALQRMERLKGKPSSEETDNLLDIIEAYERQQKYVDNPDDDEDEDEDEPDTSRIEEDLRDPVMDIGLYIQHTRDSDELELMVKVLNGLTAFAQAQLEGVEAGPPRQQSLEDTLHRIYEEMPEAFQW